MRRFCPFLRLTGEMGCNNQINGDKTLVHGGLGLVWGRRFGRHGEGVRGLVGATQDLQGELVQAPQAASSFWRCEGSGLRV